MKSLFKKFGLIPVAALVLSVLMPVLAEAQIVSAPGGGVWSVPSTWIGGVVPTASDDVIIDSEVSVNGNSCNCIQVNSGGILRNHTSNTYTLNVYGSLINNGVISNNAGFGFLLNVYGSIANDGVMSNTSLNFSGSGNQQISSVQPFSLANFTKSTQTGRVIAISDLSFTGTNINFLNDTLEFTGNSQLMIDGGNLSNAIIYKSSLPALKITAGNGTYASSLTLSSPQTEFYGSLLINGSSNYFRNNFINYGTLRNYPGNTYTLFVPGNFTNNGTLQNNVFSLILNITGNVANNANWENFRTILSGTVNQELSMTQVFSGAELIRTNDAGRIQATSSLDFEGTEIQLNGDTLEFTTGTSITLNGGRILSGVVYKSSMHALSMNNGNETYFYNLVVDAPQLQLAGSLIIYGSGVFLKSDVINNGTLRNYHNNSYTLHVPGNFTNNGTVANNVYDFYVNISGNLTNNGVWNNYGTILNGNSNQLISMTQPFAGQAFSRAAGAGRLIAATDLAFNNTIINLNNDTLQFATGAGITLSGGCIMPGVLIKTALPALRITAGDGTYLQNLRIDAPETELYGTITVYGSSHNFKTSIINNGTLQNYPNNSYILTINGSVTNNGTIHNNVYDLYLNISGNLANNGVWTNRSTVMNGAVNQLVSMSQPFGGYSFERVNANGRLQATSNLSFTNTIITLNSDTLEFTTGNSLVMNGGYLNPGALYKTAPPALKITAGGGNFIYNQIIDAPQTELYGVIMIYGNNNNFKNSVINNGTLQNRPNNAFQLTINGNLINNGSIRNNVYDFILNISGNINNNGNWMNKTTTLTGTSAHLFAFSREFEGENLVNNSAAGYIIATTDLTFDGTNIDLNGCLVTLPDGGCLSVLNGCILDASVSGTDLHFRSLGAYCQNTAFLSDVTLHGVFQAGIGVNFSGGIVNEGMIKNRGVNSYGIQVQGDIHNNGIIMNNVYLLTITVLGDIYNNGTWANYLTILDGTTDQHIVLINGRSIAGTVRLDANFTGSGLAWWGPQGNLIGNPGFSGANSLILTFLNPVSDVLAGQYYCLNNAAVQSRSIYISTLIIPVRTLTLTLLLEGLYDGSGMMNPAFDANGNAIWDATITDQITVDFHDGENYENTFLSVPEVLLYANGNATLTIPSAYDGNYYLSVRHRNSIETVSASPVSFIENTAYYNFANSAGQAYGANQKDLNGDGSLWGFYSGEVTQDGYIEFIDVISIYNRNVNGASGYSSEDIDGNGYVEFLDYIIAYNNSINSAGIITPAD